jgi:hypothetical protein
MRCSPCRTDGGRRLCCSAKLRMGGSDGGQETVAFNERQGSVGKEGSSKQYRRGAGLLHNTLPAPMEP